MTAGRHDELDEGLKPPVQKIAGRRHSPRARHAARTRPLRRVLTALVVTVAVLLVGGTATAFVAYQRLNGNINREDIGALLDEKDRPEKIVEDEGGKEPLNILLMGSDKRSGEAAQHVQGERSDTTILLHLAADRESAVAVSIPRDSVVDIPSCRKSDGTVVSERPAEMFNSAFSEAGAACTVKTVEKLTDIRIDNYVVIDFRGFKDMVNALHGVEVCIPYAVNDPQSHLDLAAGKQKVWGKQALAYVRTRHGLGNGSDLSRIDRQQAFLSSMVNRVKDKGLLLHPLRLYNFLAAATQSITTDFGGLRQMSGLARDVRGLSTKDIEFVTVPNEPYTLDPNRVQWKDSAETLWRSLRFDQPLPGKEPKPSTSSTATPTQTGPPLVTPPENVRVEVLNGSGVAGEASRVARELTAAGFQVVSVGNADRSDYPTTEVRYDPAFDESGRTLGASITGSEVIEDVQLGTTLRVIVGADSPAASSVDVSGSTASPEAEESIETRSAADDICS